MRAQAQGPQSVSDFQHFTAQAERCRRLARHADEREARILKDMAADYEAKARALRDT